MMYLTLKRRKIEKLPYNTSQKKATSRNDNYIYSSIDIITDNPQIIFEMSKEKMSLVSLCVCVMYC